MLHADDDDTIVTTDDEDEEPTVHLDPETTYANDEEFDPYNSGLNDFTFEEAVDENEVI
jgi:hypothetical protein